MASIFLSYARDDVAKAERIARAIEQSGHSVWWDRDLHTGAHFTAEIDRSLRTADAVVVLWSKESVTSAWVQDEAAVGRDANRLFPILLERVLPPLGFRQFQAIDLSGWSGRGNSRALKEVVRAINAHSGGTMRPAHIAVPHRAKGRSPWIVAAILAVAIGGVLAFLLTRTGDGSERLVVSASQSGDVRASRDFAHQVALDLSQFRSTYLSSLIVTENEGPAEYRAELGLSSSDANPRADIKVTMARRRGLTWADTIQGESGRIVDLRQQAASVLNAVIRCALEADAARAKLKDEDLRLYLDGCVTVSTNLWEGNATDLVPIFKKVTQSNPDFAPAQAMLAMAGANSILDTDPSERPALIRQIRAALARAKALDPQAEDVIAVDSMVHSRDAAQWGHALPILERGLQMHPNSVILLSFRSQRLMSLGRWKEAANNARQALQFDPLSPQIRVNFIDALAHSDRLDAAYDQLKRAEAIWPDASILEDTRYRLNLRYGDPREALQLLKKRSLGDFANVQSDHAWRDFLLARLNPSPSTIEIALESFRERYRRNPADVPGYIQALGTFGRIDEAFAITTNPVTLDSMEASTDTLFRPHMRKLYSDPRFMGLAHRLGMLGYWRKTDAWPDFCDDVSLPYDCRKEAAKYR